MPATPPDPHDQYRHPLDRLQARICDQIRGSIPQMGPPALPFLDRIEYHLLAMAPEIEYRLILVDGQSFAIRITHGWLHDAYLTRPVYRSAQEILAQVAELYIHEAMRAHPHMVVAIPPRMDWGQALMRAHAGLEPIPEPDAITTRPWDEAAREHWRRRQRREPERMRTYTGYTTQRQVFNPPAQELPDYNRIDQMMREAERHREAAYMRARAAMYQQPEVFFWDEGGRRVVGQQTRHPHAEARGRKLLIDNLTAEQRHDYETKGYFDVIGGDSGARYRILHGTHMNILALDGRKKNCLCVVPKGKLVHGDVMLMQKLALELEENKALREANHFFWAPEHVALTEEIAKGEAERYARRCQDSERISSG